MADNQLQVILDEQGVAQDNARQLIAAFGAPFEEAGVILFGEIDESTGEIITPNYKSIVVEREDDFATMAEARSKRLALKDIRVGVENKRKELKEDSLRTGRAIDSVAKFVKETIEPAEEYLKLQEKFAEIKQAERATAVKADRVAKLLQYTSDLSIYNLDALDDTQFDSLLASLEALKKAEAKIEAEETAARLAAAKAENKRQAKILAENVRLKAEADKREKADAKKMSRVNELTSLGLIWNEQFQSYVKDDFNVSKIEILSASDQSFTGIVLSISEEILRRALVEQEEGLARAKADREKREAEAKELEAEREKAAKLEQEKRDREATEAKVKADAEETQRQALLAPDKEKLLAFASMIDSIDLPALASKDAQAVLNNVEELLAKVSTYIRGNVKGL